MTRKITHICSGTCSRQIEIEIDQDTIRSVAFTGGCHGNTQGIAALVRGIQVREVIARLEGIDCRGKGTSCPDQLAKALKKPANSIRNDICSRPFVQKNERLCISYGIC